MARMSTQQEIHKSIMDLRSIYPELSDDKFAKWYSKKYKIPVAAVIKVLSERTGTNDKYNKSKNDRAAGH